MWGRTVRREGEAQDLPGGVGGQRRRGGSLHSHARAPDPAADFDRHGFLDALRPYLEHRGLNVDWDTAEAAPQEALINSLAMALPFEAPEKQALLEAQTLDARAAALTALLRIEAAANDDDDGPAMQ